MDVNIVQTASPLCTVVHYYNYPVHMRRGKVIGRVVVVVDTKIAKSEDVRT